MRLIDLYSTLDKDARNALAKAADIDPGYLWQIATHWREKKPSLNVVRRLAHADARLTLGDLADEFSDELKEADHV